MEMLDDDGLGM